MKNYYKILLVEDDPNFGSILKEYLTLNNYKIILAKNGIEGYEKFVKNNFDLCILDVMMPYKDGFTLAREIREKNEKLPIFFLTAKTLKEDLLKGFKIGADDYLTKPFDSEVLLAKIKYILNKNKGYVLSNKDPEVFEFEFGDFLFNSRIRSLVYKKDITIKLSPKESKLLKLLVLNLNDLVTRDLALNSIWREDNYFTSRSMDVYIAKLRKHLSLERRLEIINIHGEGFRLKID
jgi:two-component system OmpR family response regulator